MEELKNHVGGATILNNAAIKINIQKWEILPCE